MELLYLPTEVIDIIISQCDLSALLQLRLVSKTTNVFVNTSPSFPKALEDIQINLESYTLKTFIETAPRLPFSNLSINHTTFDELQDDSEFYSNNSDFQTLLKVYCPHIRILHVHTLFGCRLEEEFNFFQALQSLRELNIGQIKLPKTFDKNSEMQSHQRLPFMEPNSKIKRLIVDQEHDSGDYLIQLIKLCPSLEVTKVTRSIGEIQLGSVYYGQSQLTNINNCHPYLLRLGSEGHLKHLKQLDLNCKTIEMDLCTTQDMQFFQELLSNTNVQLDNVTPLFLHEVLNCSRLPVESKEAFKQRIRYFHGMSQLLKGEGFVNLNEVHFDSSNSWPREDIQFPNNGAPRLPKLTRIYADLSNVNHLYPGGQDFVEFLFHPDQPRSKVTDLEILYKTGNTVQPSTWIFQSSILETGFPNLTRLIFADKMEVICSHVQLCNFIQVISTKIHLVALDLFTHRGFPEEAFIGPNPSEPPIFLRLKNLKELALEDGLALTYSEPRQKMGNRMLSLLSKMSLTYANITGGDWDNVTRRAVRKLVDCPFGRSIIDFLLEFLVDTEKHSGARKRLVRIAHHNRMTKGLTSSSYEDFEESKHTLLLYETHSFRGDVHY